MKKKVAKAKSSKKVIKHKEIQYKTADDVLKVIKDFFLIHSTDLSREHQANYYERQKLWDILCALRGPDNSNSFLKRATTEVIRYKLFGYDCQDCQANSCKDDVGSVDFRVQLDLPTLEEENFPWHFRNHAKAAFLALGLEWEKINR